MWRTKRTRHLGIQCLRSCDVLGSLVRDMIPCCTLSWELTLYVPDAAIVSVLDYKMMFSRSYGSPEEEADAYSQCHTRSAKRVLKALLANGGAYGLLCQEQV